MTKQARMHQRGELIAKDDGELVGFITEKGIVTHSVEAHQDEVDNWGFCKWCDPETYAMFMGG